MGKIIEGMIPHHIPGTKRAYHAITKNLITNEIFRRIEPKGRTMGEYFEQEMKD